MSKIFTRTYRARYSDINADAYLAPADIARYIIDTAYDWGDTLGLGYGVTTQLGFYWIIRETEIQLLNPLHFLDEFDFTIWMLEWRRVRGKRAFVVQRKKDGALIAQGVQQIACMNIKANRPDSPPEELIENFRLDVPREIPSQRFPQITAPPEGSFTIQLKVAWQDLDILEIVNNAVYISYAEEALVQVFDVLGWSPIALKTHGLARVLRRLHVQYQMPASWGEVINLTVFPLNLNNVGGSFFVGMTRALDGASIASCVLDWELIDRESGEVHPLPESLRYTLTNTFIA